MVINFESLLDISIIASVFGTIHNTPSLVQSISFLTSPVVNIFLMNEHKGNQLSASR